MPLLLSPAGSMQALKSAIKAGADEVYLGGNAFNARMNASNFDRKTLISAGELCRNYGVGMHITLNTLIYDREFKSVLEYVSFLENEVHPDALIVQDLGLVKVIRQNFPSVPLHASTQMRIHSFEDAENLKKLGFTRAVLARELPAEDIKAFALSGLDTEIFIHGAICISESGGCLMSSVIGGRSGNRGECAQPCRLPCRTREKYPLSVKDMCLAGHIGEIIDTGVKSLKIEGRMKSPEYVGAVTSVYRRLIDEKRNATEKEIKLLESVFSRSGFTDGYFTSKLDSSFFGVRTEFDKRKSESFSFSFPSSAARKKIPEKQPPEFIMPVRDEEKTLSPAKQRGIVLRFEGKLPSERFLKKHAEKAVRIDIPLEYCTDARFAPYAEKISAVLPRSVFISECERIKSQIKKAYAFGIRHATVSSLYQANWCEGFFLHGDYAFNVVNRETIEMLQGYSFSSVMLSPETDGKFPRGSKCALEYIGYGRTPLMYTRVCVICNITGCQKKSNCKALLTDRTGSTFPVLSGHDHTNIIYNSLPSYRLDKIKELKKCGVGLVTLLFTDETERETENVISLCNTDAKPDFKYTRR